MTAQIAAKRSQNAIAQPLLCRLWRRSRRCRKPVHPARIRPPCRNSRRIAPRGQREVKDITYGDWRKLCFKPGGAQMHCRTSITGKFATGQMAVRLDIIERTATAMHGCRCSPPSACICRSRPSLRSTKAQPHPVPYTWCLTNACIAGDRGDPKMVQEMASGQTLRLEFVDSNLLTLTTSLPLGQFASIHKGPPAQTFEQDIDE